MTALNSITEFSAIPRQSWLTGLFVLVATTVIDAGLFSTTAAQDAADATPPAAGSSVTDTNQVAITEKSLSDNQLSVSGRYSRLERMLSQMADIMGRDDPERADLLRRTISKGREQRIGDRVEKIVTLLQDQDFGAAVEQQREVTEGLQALLVLLQSEDRRSSVEKERERLNNLLKNVRNLITEERSARIAAQNSPAPSNAAAPQQKVLDKATSLLDDVQKTDAERMGIADQEGEQKDPDESAESEPAAEPGDSQESPEISEDGQSSEENKSSTPEGQSSTPEKPPGQPAESRPGTEPSESEPKPASDPQPSESGPKNNSSEAENKEGQQGEQTPGRQQLQEAQKLMQEALERLKEQQRDPALQKQDDAIAELHKAASSLEQMLRQLREEEKEMLLASLEARLQKLLAVQVQIQSATTELAATPKEQWLDRYFDRCRELSQQQTDQTSECSMTTGLLREDGTSVSVLMAMEDIESDMNSVAGYLRQSDVGSLTQSIQADIVESLKQLIEATQQEMEAMKDEEHESQPSQQNETKPPLVELMAEIKVLRSLQLRVNRRTTQVDQLLSAASPEQQPDLHRQVNELASRQLRLVESAKELSQKMSER